EFVFAEHKLEQANIMFIPGSGHPQLAVEAARLYHQGWAPWILPSGRYSITTGKFSGVLDKQECYQGSYETEWDFLSQVLQEKGVPGTAILKEDRATYTYENAIYSRQVTDGMGLEIKKAILCSKPYHARRCLLYYQLLYPDTKFMVYPIKDSKIQRDNWFLTEEGTRLVFGELERMGTQFHEIMREMRETQ
ncbi:MAG: YdcF family protein, partial [Blautia sp.]|nr:YdcF family protein [Blautia sp.]